MILRRVLTSLLAGLASSMVWAVPVVSGDGNESCRMMHGDPACNVQTISVHSLWQTNDPVGQGASWISYADTGALGSTLAVAPADGDSGAPDPQNPLMLVQEVLTDISAGTRLTMDLWADDTAQVQLRYDDGSEFFGAELATLLTANFTQETCARGAGGCEPEDRARLEYTFTDEVVNLLQGRNVWLQFMTFQVGAGITNATNPFGLLYSGTLEPGAVAVPEPPAAGLLVGGALLVMLGRRRRAA